MASPIGPGDEVACVDASGAAARSYGLRVDHRYTVNSVGVVAGWSFLRVSGIGGGWHPDRFRKIDLISDEFRKALLTPVPLDLEPVEEAQRSEPAEPVPTHGTKARSLSQLQQKEDVGVMHLSGARQRARQTSPHQPKQGAA